MGTVIIRQTCLKKQPKTKHDARNKLEMNVNPVGALSYMDSAKIKGQRIDGYLAENRNSYNYSSDRENLYIEPKRKGTSLQTQKDNDEMLDAYALQLAQLNNNDTITITKHEENGGQFTIPLKKGDFHRNLGLNPSNDNDGNLGNELNKKKNVKINQTGIREYKSKKKNVKINQLQTGIRDDYKSKEKNVKIPVIENTNNHDSDSDDTQRERPYHHNYPTMSTLYGSTVNTLTTTHNSDFKMQDILTGIKNGNKPHYNSYRRNSSSESTTDSTTESSDDSKYLQNKVVYLNEDELINKLTNVQKNRRSVLL